MYAKLTKDKTKDARTLEDILIAYDNGNLRVPCVQVQCIGFDDDFFSALLAERDARHSTVPWPRIVALLMYLYLSIYYVYSKPFSTEDDSLALLGLNLLD